MPAQIVPLSSSPNQSISVTIPIDGGATALRLYVYFNEMAGLWLMDVASQFGALLICSIPLITGTYPAGNMLASYRHLRIGSAYIINAGGSSSDFPDTTNLGTDFVLLWDDTPVQ